MLLMNPKFLSLRAAVLCALFLQTAWLTAAVTPLPNAHAHNDYHHPRPLLDALEVGFCSVEADVYLVGDELLVAHDREDLVPEKNLKDMYLTPLLERAKEHDGAIYPDGPAFYLMIDFKSEAGPTYAALRKLLWSYREMLTEYGGDGLQYRAVTVVISGNRPTETLAREKLRYAFIDGRISDLDANESPVSLIPWISENWQNHFNWNGRGEFSDQEKLKLKQWIDKAHEQGRKVRFWATPETGNYWKTAYEAGLDFINTDRLERLQQILIGLQSAP
ncbi:MAG: hypothetical protein HOH33_05730 [Verrucomicrobia bacterium]|nr:hypothetical protein [Verrucomicrobiota bacterium]